MISVITPVYNAENFICETIDSVLLAAQDYDVEYIVIDDGSTDRTLDKLQIYGDRIRLISTPNRGESAAVNLGIREATGNILLVVSADDPLPNGEVFRGAEDFFSKNPQVVAWFPNWDIINEIGQKITSVLVEEYSDDLLIGRFKCLPGPGTLFRRDAALSIGGRNEKWTFVGDYDFWLRLSRIGRLVKRDEVVAQWRYHDKSTSIAKRGPTMAIERISVISEFLMKNEVDKEIQRMAIAHSHFFAARLSFFDSNVPGKRLLTKALVVSRGRLKDGNFFVYLFIYTLPFSRIFINPLKPLLKKFGYLLT